jgi:hypothetical protein
MGWLTEKPGGYKMEGNIPWDVRLQSDKPVFREFEEKDEPFIFPVSVWYMRSYNVYAS